MNNKTNLELTWIGKENRPRLEPRILLEDAEKSYHAKYRVRERIVLTAENAKSAENSKSLRSLRSLRLNDPGDRFDNRLIFGDNLLAIWQRNQGKKSGQPFRITQSQLREVAVHIDFSTPEIKPCQPLHLPLEPCLTHSQPIY